MKKNLTKKLMLSVLTLAFAVVSLGASTFAWFTLSGSVKVEQLKANVTGGFGLDVTVTPAGAVKGTDWFVDEATWYTGNLPASAFTSVLADVKFDAVTPGTATLTKGQTFQKLTGNAMKTNLIAFDLQFRITDPSSVSEDLYLSLTNIALSSASESAWKADIAYELANGEQAVVGTNYKYNILSAARFAIVGADATYTHVFEQKAVTPQTAVSNTEGFSDKGAVDYYNKKMNLADADKIEVADATVYETTKLENFAFAADPAGTNNNEYTLFKVEKYGVDADNQCNTNTDDIFTATVYIWVEGWDAECINAIFNQELTIDMTYALADASGKLK